MTCALWWTSDLSRVYLLPLHWRHHWVQSCSADGWMVNSNMCLWYKTEIHKVLTLRGLRRSEMFSLKGKQTASRCQLHLMLGKKKHKQIPRGPLHIPIVATSSIKCILFCEWNDCLTYASKPLLYGPKPKIWMLPCGGGVQRHAGVNHVASVFGFTFTAPADASFQT